MKRDYFHALDGIRGILALTVAFYHVQWAGLFTSNAFIQNGYLAVDFFFCLSGFLMFRLYGGMQSAADAKSFLRKRFVRIYPLHLFTLCAMAAYLGLRLIIHKMGYPIIDPGEALPFSPESTDNAGTFLSNVFLTQSMGLHDSLTFNGPAWSISVEFYTYIVFAIITIIAPIKTPLHILYVLLFGLMTYAFLALNKPNLDVTYDLGILRCFAGFSIGMVSSWLFDLDRQPEKSSGRIKATLLELLVLVMSAYWVIAAEGVMTFTIAPILLSLMIVFAAGNGWISHVLGRGIFQYLGKISYSIYLNHALIIVVFNVALNKAFGDVLNISYEMGTLISLVYLCVVLLSSHITYHLVEMPATKWLSRKRKKPAIKGRIESIVQHTRQNSGSGRVS